MRQRLLVFLASLSVPLALTPPLPAHPVPKDNHDRTLVVRLTPAGVVVVYRLEWDETTGARELPKSEIPGISNRRELHETISRYFADVLADNLVATLDGKQLTFRCVRRSHAVTDHVRCDYRFEARWTPQPGSQHKFTFRESNFEDDNFSSLRLRVTGDGRLNLRAMDAPSEALMDRPGADRKPNDGERLRTATATFSLSAVGATGAYKPALPPDLDQTRLDEDISPPRLAPPKSRPSLPVAWNKPRETTGHEDAPAGSAKLFPGHPPEIPVEASVPPATNAPSDTAPPEETDTSLPTPHNLLNLLLDSRYGVGLLLLLAALFGAAHALTPGHGKTLVAAYLVGERGTVWHALLLGVVTTLTHTGVVLLVAAVLPIFFPNAAPARVQTVLGLVGGLLIAGLGVWLLLRRLTGQADHIHLGGGHNHHHGHDHNHDHSHAHDQAPAASGSKGVGLGALVMLGVSGGIVPCWDALLMLGYAISAHRLNLALPMLLAFSAGLAGVLVALGIGVVLARNYAGARWGKAERWRGLARALPLLSAVLIAAMGLWLCYDSVQLATTRR